MSKEKAKTRQLPPATKQGVGNQVLRAGGVEATLHPAFEARIRDRFDFGEHPPLMLDPGGAGTFGATYLLEGTEEEIAALAEQIILTTRRDKGTGVPWHMRGELPSKILI